MKDMLKYLNEVEEMMGGNDLAQIRKMIRYQNETLEHHIVSYDKIKAHVDDMNKGKCHLKRSMSLTVTIDALNALKSL